MLYLFYMHEEIEKIEKIRICLWISKDDVDTMRELAEFENRSLNNYVVNVLKRHIVSVQES